MVDVKFCPNCGEKRVPDARFCVACGVVIAKNRNQTYLIYAISAVVLIITTLIIFGIVLLVKSQPAQPVAVQSSQEAEHDHDHAAEDPNLAALKEKAETGGAAAVMDLAEYLFAHGEQDKDYLFQAAIVLEKLAESFPDHAYTLRLLGNLYFDMGIPEKAVTYYRKYLDIHPDDPNVRTDLGTQLLRLEKMDEAIAEYQTAIGLFPDFYNTHFNLSIAYERMGDSDKAKTHREKALEIEKRLGQKARPSQHELPRLPDDAAPGQPVSEQRIAQPAAEWKTNSGLDYGPLAIFFREHLVIGPKMTGFRINGERALLFVRNFPMDAMPASMRQSFELKIRDQLKAVGDQAMLEIRDADLDKTLATYEAAVSP